MTGETFVGTLFILLIIGTIGYFIYSGVQASKAYDRQFAPAPTVQQPEETVKGKEVTAEQPVIYITWGALAKWYLEEGYSIEGVTPLNAMSTMRDMMEGRLRHTISTLIEPRPTRRLKHIPLERKPVPFSSPTYEKESRQELVETIELEEPLEEDEAYPPINASSLIKPEEEEEMEETEDEEEVVEEPESSVQPSTPTLFPSRSLPPTQVSQDIPFKALAQVDPVAFREQVMLLYEGALQKQEEQPERPLTREIIGVQGARWKHLFSSTEGILRKPGFITDAPGGGFTLSPDTERLSTFLQNYTSQQQQMKGDVEEE